MEGEEGGDRLTHQNKVESPFRGFVLLQSNQAIRGCVVATADLAHEGGQDLEIDVVIVDDEDVNILRLVRWANREGVGGREIATCHGGGRHCHGRVAARRRRLSVRTGKQRPEEYWRCGGWCRLEA